MKKFLLAIILLIPFLSFAQYIVIDPGGKARKTSNIASASSVNDLVIHGSDLDSVVVILESYHDLISKNVKATSNFTELKAGATTVRVRSKRAGAVDRYQITIETSINGSLYRRILTDLKLANPENARRLKDFIESLSQL